MYKFLGRPKFINPLGHKTILGPSAQGWFCGLRWKNLVGTSTFSEMVCYLILTLIPRLSNTDELKVEVRS